MSDTTAPAPAQLPLPPGPPVGASAAGKPSPQSGRRVVPLSKESPSKSAGTFWAIDNPFAPQREGNKVHAYVDGKDMMAAFVADLATATSFVYITDWQISANVHLLRGATLRESDRLINLLAGAAGRGVAIRILLWDSTDLLGYGQQNYDITAESELQKKHKNIRVIRHSFAANWSHHQKTIVIDGRVAFVGGLDLCNGRWDTQDHHLNTSRPEFGEDKYNPCIKDYAGDFAAPRMPWHDVHLRIEGPSVFDVERNFVGRWNFSRVAESSLTMSRKVPPTGSGKQWVQILRSGQPLSVGPAESGKSFVDTSINEAYIRAIENASHYIYVENQYLGLPANLWAA